MQQEIDQFVQAALSGQIPWERLSFATNKVYKQEGNAIGIIGGGIGEVFAKLAEVNCKLWHEQEKVYEIEKVPAGEKDQLIRNLAILNLERNQCIEQIDKQFRVGIETNQPSVPVRKGE